MGDLKGRTRILVSNQLQYLPFADHVVVMENGRIAEQGNLQWLQSVRRENRHIPFHVITARTDVIS